VITSFFVYFLNFRKVNLHTDDTQRERRFKLKQNRKDVVYDEFKTTEDQMRI